MDTSTKTNTDNNISDVEETEENEGDKSQDLPWRVYSAHALSTWGDNMWWFAGGCYMLELDGRSLRLTALYGLVIAASVIVFGASIGRWIDRTPRLTAARTFLTIQNVAVSLCALILSGFIHYGGLLAAPTSPTQVPNNATYSHNMTQQDQLAAGGNDITGWKTGVSVGAILLAAVARLASTGTNIIIQKDWIVVISAGDHDRLATMNSILRTIELTTYMLAPGAAGLFFTFLGYTITGVIIAGWNVVSVTLEYLLLSLIYRRYPGLSRKKSLPLPGAHTCSSPPGHCPSVADLEVLPIETGSTEKEEEAGGWRRTLKEAYTGWLVYFHHPVRRAGVGLAMLYMTVLGFDNITYGYCLMQNVPEAVLGGLVAVSALVGVAGSLAYPHFRKSLGQERTGLVGMALLISCSSLAVISTFLPGSPMDLEYLVRGKVTEGANNTVINGSNTEAALVEGDYWVNYLSVSAFLIGIITARFGLWVVDLTVTQILQENVEEEKRGVVGGVQDALNNTLDLAKCILVILLPAEETFALLIYFSFVSINFGWFMYALYSRQERGHLFHFGRLVTVLPSGLLLHKERRQGGEKPEEAEERQNMMNNKDHTDCNINIDGCTRA